MKFNSLFAVVSLLAILSSCSKKENGSVAESQAGASLKNTPTVSALPPGNWTHIFNDNFDGTTLNLNKWAYGFGWGPKSDAFLETTRPANTTVSGGTLKIKMECNGTGGYWSGAINTKNKLYQNKGYWEARIKLPKARAGLLPAFWLKPNSEAWPPEIDIIETFGASRIAKMSVHYGTSSSPLAKGLSYDAGDLSTAFHIYGMEWNTDYIRWYIDGVKRAEITRTSPDGNNILNQMNAAGGMYAMINLHSWGGDSAGKLTCTGLPVYMEVDYVNIYKKAP